MRNLKKKTKIKNNDMKRKLVTILGSLAVYPSIFKDMTIPLSFPGQFKGKKMEKKFQNFSSQIYIQFAHFRGPNIFDKRATSENK